ncbi:MAG TPA: hypothetical protein VFZ59_21625 [Verrucomicrobiae bacterium]|nr:hypothetical protein [Verrucomicrobiae bacterium]
MFAGQSAPPSSDSHRVVRNIANVLLTVLLIGTVQRVHAASITWIGGDATWDASAGRWNPADEPDADDIAIFNTANSVNLAMANAVMGLTLSGGIDLNTGGYNLDVDGPVQLSDASTTLIVSSNSLLSADRITINNGGILRLANGIATISEEAGNGVLDINVGGTLTGNGAVNLTDAVAANTPLIINDGAITAASTAPNDLLGNAAATLTINATDSEARIDLDGAAEAGDVNVSVNDTLEINLPLADIFNGTLNLARGSTLSMNAPWIMGPGAVVNANTFNLLSGTPGSAATIAGATLSLNNGAINLDDFDSLRFSAPLSANGGTISNAGHVIFNANATISGNANFLMIGAVASLTVNSNVIVNIDDPDFDLDGGGSVSNIVTINSGGVLGLDLGAGADEALSGTINLNGGELDVTTLDNNWRIDGVVNVGANTGVSQINGEEVTFANATVTVGDNAGLNVNAASVWAAAGHLVIQSGAVATLNAGFEPGSTLTLNAATCHVTAATDFAGAMSVGASGDSTLQGNGTFVFQNGSVTTLNGNLQLNNPTTIVQPGADFAGGGAVISRVSRVLQLMDGVVSGDLNVLVQNEGVLQLGAANSDAQVSGKSFQQAASGSLQIEIGGTALTSFDRFNLTGAATLSGELSVSLINGFVPALGQTFDILTASVISGKFTTINQPAGMPAGRVFSVAYSPTVVQLTVTTPYEAWINSFPTLTAPADKLKTADPDHDGRNNLVEFALDGNPTNAIATGKVVVKVAPVGGMDALTLTFPVRAGVTFDPTDPAGGPLVLKHLGDAVSYRIEASEDLTNVSWTQEVTVVAGADAVSIQSGLPALNAGWVYRTFRSPGPVGSDPEEFMRLVIGE